MLTVRRAVVATHCNLQRAARELGFCLVSKRTPALPLRSDLSHANLNVTPLSVSSGRRIYSSASCSDSVALVQLRKLLDAPTSTSSRAECWRLYELIRNDATLFGRLTVRDFRALLSRVSHLRVTIVLADLKKAGFRKTLPEHNHGMAACLGLRDHKGVKAAHREMLAAGVQPDVVTYNILLRVAARIGNYVKANQLIQEMARSGISLDAESHVHVLRAHVKAGKDMRPPLESTSESGIILQPSDIERVANGCVQEKQFESLGALLAVDGASLALSGGWLQRNARSLAYSGDKTGLRALWGCFEFDNNLALPTLSGFLKTCVAAYDAELAGAVFARMSSSPNFSPGLDTYALLLTAYANSADTDRIQTTLNLINSLGVPLNMSAYAAMIHAHTFLRDSEAVAKLLAEIKSTKLPPSGALLRSIIGFYQASEDADAWKSLIVEEYWMEAALEPESARLVFKLCASKEQDIFLVDTMRKWISSRGHILVRDILDTEMEYALGAKDDQYAHHLYVLMRSGKRMPSTTALERLFRIAIASEHPAANEYLLALVKEPTQRKSRTSLADDEIRTELHQPFVVPKWMVDLCELGIAARLPAADQYFQGLLRQERNVSIVAMLRLFNSSMRHGVELSKETQLRVRGRLVQTARNNGLLTLLLSPSFKWQSFAKFEWNTRKMILSCLLEADIDSAIAYLHKAGIEAIAAEPSKVDTSSLIVQLSGHPDLAKALECFAAFRRAGVYPDKWASPLFLRRLLAAPDFADAARFLHAIEHSKDDTMKPDQRLYNVVLLNRARAKDVASFRKYWHHMTERFEPSQYDFSARIILHLGRGDLKSALKDLARVRQKFRSADIKVWGLLIHGALQLDDFPCAVESFRVMQKDGVSPNLHIYSMFLQYHLRKGDRDAARAIQEDIVKAGVATNLHSITALIAAAARDGDSGLAQRYFDQLDDPDAFAYTALMGAYAADDHLDGVVRVWEDMRRTKREPTVRTVGILAAAYARAGDHQNAVAVLRDAGKKGMGLTADTHDKLWRSYALAGDGTRMMDHFNEYLLLGGVLDLGVHNRLMEAYSAMGNTAAVESQFMAMRAAGCTPDAASYTALIRTFAKNGDMFAAGEWWTRAMDAGCVDVKTVSAVVESFLVAGYHEAAENILERSTKIQLDAACFNPFVGYWAKKDMDRIPRLVEKMRARGVEPDCSTWTVVMDAVKRAGRYEESWGIWSAMSGRNDPPLSSDEIASKAAHWNVQRLRDADMYDDPRALLSVLLDLCGFAGFVPQARRLWSEFVHRSPLQENHLASYIECLARNGFHQEAVAAIMDEVGHPGRAKPGTKSFGTLLSFLTRDKQLDLTAQVVEHMRRVYPGVAERVSRLYRINLDKLAGEQIASSVSV
ncbi:hypothetical protein HKX48_001276 [Thoreauomyces humboldtii]|nr:hypothetical protein HKX48_001276 [Thoreauomyces humboldtii]